jgi:RHS repeat-associated protein
MRLCCRWLAGRTFRGNSRIGSLFRGGLLGVVLLGFPGTMPGAPLAPSPRPEHLSPLLRPVESPGESESIAFNQALERFALRSQRDDFTSLTDFLDAFPRGAWSPALRLQLAEEYHQTGWYSIALQTLRDLWNERGQGTTAEAAVFSTRVGVRLMELSARLGRREEVEELESQLSGIHLHPDDVEVVRGVQQGLESMRHRPENAFRCGALALERIRVFLNPTDAGHPRILDSISTTNGMTLSAVAALADSLGMRFQMAWRTPGAALPTPAVMHLQIGHFVAVLKERNGRFQLSDPTGWQTTFARSQAIDHESSGYFLIPAGPLPAGWRPVDSTEAERVFGRNGVLDNDPDATTPRDKQSPCSHKLPSASHGMAGWNVHLMLLSQQLFDTPIGYEPPFGPSVSVTMRHTQRSNTRFGYRPEWTHEWSGQFYESPLEPLGDLWLQDGGGWERFSPLDEEGKLYQGKIFNVGRVRRTASTNLTWEFPDGTQRNYTAFTGTNVAWGRTFYLTSIEDASGNRVSIQGLESGRVTSLTDALGRVTRFYYELTDPGLPPDRNPPGGPPTSGVIPNYFYTNQLTRIVDPFGRVAKFQYAKVERSVSGYCNGDFGCPFYYYNYDLTNIVDVAGFSSQMAYDPSGLVITNLTTPYGTTRFKWGSQYAGRYALEVTDPEGDTERFEYLGYGSVLPSTANPIGVRVDGGGATVAHWSKKAYAERFQSNSVAGATLYQFQLSDTLNSAGRVLKAVRLPLENPVWFNYPGQGSAALPGIGDRPSLAARVLDDGTTQVWQSERDDWGNVIRQTDPLGRTTRYRYDANHVDLLEVDQVVGETVEPLLRTTWDVRHLPLTQTDAGGGVTRFAYNARGQLVSVTNALQEVTALSYDANGFLTAIDGPLPGAQDRRTFTQDPVGRVRTVTDGDGYTLTFDYDALDRMTQVTFPDGTSEALVYDRMEVGIHRDRLGRQTALTYDGMRRLTSMQDALGQVTQFQWCGCGALTAVLDPLGRMTRWQRDVQGRVIAKEYPDGSQIIYDYEASTSRVRNRRDERGQVTEYQYNLADELVSKRYVGALVPTPNVSFAYDPSYARLVSHTDGDGVTTYQYVPHNGTPGAGQLSVIDGPLDNDAITFTYDALGRRVSTAVNTVASRKTFDAAGRLIQLTNGLGSFSLTYDAGSDRLATMTYPNGQRSESAYAGNDRDHRLTRLTHYLGGGGKLSEFTYAYNALGTITNWSQFQAGQLKNWSIAYDALNRLTNVVETIGANPSTVTTYGYDAVGNRIVEKSGTTRLDTGFNALNQPVSFTAGAAPTPVAYQWDAENRLVGVSNRAYRVFFGYDGLDRRTRIVVSNATALVYSRRYVWLDQKLLEEREKTGGRVLKRYYFDGIQNPGGQELPAGNYYFTRDHLGSIREVTGPGTVALGYSPFGIQTALSGSISIPFGFTGHFQNPESGLVLAPFRAYSPDLARWLNRDPVGEEGGLNLYAYSGLDPINGRDALGLEGFVSWVKNFAKKQFQKTKAGKVEKKLEDFNDKENQILDAELQAKEVADDLADPDCGHSGARLLKKILGWIPKSIQLGPINSADLFGKTLDEGVKNTDAYIDRLNQRIAESDANARN